MVRATMDLDDLLKRVQAIPGVMKAYDAMDRAISSLTYRSPIGPEDPA